MAALMSPPVAMSACRLASRLTKPMALSCCSCCWNLTSGVCTCGHRPGEAGRARPRGPRKLGACNEERRPEGLEHPQSQPAGQGGPKRTEEPGPPVINRSVIRRQRCLS